MKYLIITSILLISPVFAFAQVPQEISLEEQLAELQELEGQLDEISATINEFDNPSDQAENFDVSSAELRGEVVEILETGTDPNMGEYLVFTVEADGEEFQIDTRQSLLDGLRYRVDVGTPVYIQVIYTDGVPVQVFLVDVVRTGNLFLIILLFAVVIIAIGRLRGVASLVGLGITLLILFAFIIPQILNGADPVLVTVIGSLVILAVNMHLSHGFNKNTLFAFASTAAGLSMVWLFSNLFVWFAQLSGMASEEAILLQYNAESVAGPGGILLAAIILGAVGVLDDIAITQSETVSELRAANPKMTQKELFAAGMRVGRHHIASTVNTLVLAYAGVALPLLLLFMQTQGVDTIRFLNEEPVAEEIVRTLAGTLALILTVPIATWLATYTNKR